MNCFEARQEFSALWRKTIASERRSELLAHLKRCGKCDHAFRIFALTAPVLHGSGELEGQAAAHGLRPAARREFSLKDRPRRFASAPREVVVARPSRWLPMAAAAAIFVFAASSAYLSIRVPSESLSEALSVPEANMDSEAASDPLAPEMPMTESDLAS